jgi:hypothetical protein
LLSFKVGGGKATLNLTGGTGNAAQAPVRIDAMNARVSKKAVQMGKDMGEV